jgi:hypothetical protein
MALETSTEMVRVTSTAGAARPSTSPPDLDAFLALSAAQRGPLLVRAILDAHRYHFARNAAYRRTVSARGAGGATGADGLHLLLRPASLTFKSYLETIGPFPQDDPRAFLAWLSDQLSISLPVDRGRTLPRRYVTMEGLLADLERVYADLGLEMVTSSGTSGVASVVARDAATTDLAVRSFFTGIRRAWGVDRGAAMVFVMPARTRVAMARSAHIGVRQMDWAAGTAVYYTMPFTATPDRIRLRAGRTYHPGARGVMERRVLHPTMVWADRRWVARRYVACTLARLRELSAAGRPLMLLGGSTQLHAVALAGRVDLPAGSRVATGGGSKELYPFTPAQIRGDLEAAFGGAPVADVYGMAEADWAAFECPRGNHHIPPWVFAVVTDGADHIVPGPEATGMLAFFDPVAGGDVYPPFFQTADHVTLVNGGASWDPALVCGCGDDSAYIAGDIRRADLMDEAGCAAQL